MVLEMRGPRTLRVLSFISLFLYLGLLCVLAYIVIANLMSNKEIYWNKFSVKNAIVYNNVNDTDRMVYLNAVRMARYDNAEKILIVYKENNIYSVAQDLYTDKMVRFFEQPNRTYVYRKIQDDYMYMHDESSSTSLFVIFCIFMMTLVAHESFTVIYNYTRTGRIGYII